MSNKTAGPSGRALKSLFGTFMAGGTVNPADTADGAKKPATSGLTVPSDVPAVVIDGVRPPGVPHVLPAGTIVVVNPTPAPKPNPVVIAAAAPIGVSAPVYDFPPGPGTFIVAAPTTAPSSAATRSYDFPAPEPSTNIIADYTSPTTSAASLSDRPGTVQAPGTQVPARMRTLGGSPAEGKSSLDAGTLDAGVLGAGTAATGAIPTTATAAAQLPARPTLVVSAASIEAADDTARAAVAGGVITPSDSGLPATAAASIPTPPPVSSSNPSVTGLGTGIAITDILRLAAQLSAERIAPAVPALAVKNAITVDDGRVKELRDRLIKDIDELYQKTVETVGDSPGVVAYCLDLLKKARLALLTGSTAEDLSQAEFYIEEVRSKLSRSQDPIPAGEKKNVVGLLLWTVSFWVLCLPLALLPWFAPTGQIAYWNLRIPIELIPLLATVGWGGTGGVIGTLYNMTWFVQMREYDPAYNLDYFLRPIKGFIAGGVMMLIFTAGIATLNGPQAALGADKASLGFALVYLGAALAGFKQEYVYEWFDSILKVFFRTPPSTPKQLDANAK